MKPVLLMLLVSITADLCAQSNLSDQTFSVPQNIIMHRRFYFDLDKKNRLQIELTDIADLPRIANMDSLLNIFLKDIAPLMDSIADPLSAKKIDYITDAQNRKRLRLQQYPPKGASFLLNDGEPASLRTEQDTVNIIGVITNPAPSKDGSSLHSPRYYHLTFYLNDVHEINTCTNGILNEKIAILRQHLSDKWPLILGGSSHYLKGHREIWADKPRGTSPAAIGDFINAYATVNVQNYKHYFVPSFSVGARFVFTNRDHNFKWQPSLFWEPNFLFAKNVDGKFRTYRNDFLTLAYTQGGTTDYDARKDFSFSTSFSLSYLIRRQGDMVDKNTFRLGAAKIKVGNAFIEPSMYFHDVFRGVTPGLRVSLGF